MLSVKILCVGNLKEDYWRAACNEYIKRLSRFCRTEIVECAESSPEKEKTELEKHLSGYLIALCVEGKKLSSGNFAHLMEDIPLRNSRLTFVIGGSDGLSEEIKAKADLRLSFSDMTFPHQLMRVILLEQIYRAFTINNNTRYHK